MILLSQAFFIVQIISNKYENENEIKKASNSDNNLGSGWKKKLYSILLSQVFFIIQIINSKFDNAVK